MGIDPSAFREAENRTARARAGKRLAKPEDFEPRPKAPTVFYPDRPRHWRTPVLCLTIRGQVRGGKNNMLVTRSGAHIQNPTRKGVAAYIRSATSQICAATMDPGAMGLPFTTPVDVELRYVAGDLRKRDMPMILDALWHILEKTGIVADDSLLWVTRSTRAYDKANPRVELLFYLPEVHPIHHFPNYLPEPEGGR